MAFVKADIDSLRLAMTALRGSNTDTGPNTEIDDDTAGTPAHPPSMGMAMSGFKAMAAKPPTQRESVTTTFNQAGALTPGCDCGKGKRQVRRIT